MGQVVILSPQFSSETLLGDMYTKLFELLVRFLDSLRSKRSCAILARERVLAARKLGRAQKMKRGRGGGGRREGNAYIQPL